MYVISLRNKEKINVGLHSNIYKPISFRLGLMTEITKLYFLTEFCITLTFIYGQSCEKSKTGALVFPQICVSVFRKFRMLSQSFCLLKLILTTFRTINIQGRGLYV